MNQVPKTNIEVRRCGIFSIAQLFGLAADNAMTGRTSSIKDLRIERPATTSSPMRSWLLLLLVVLLLGGATVAWLAGRPTAIPVRTAAVKDSSATIRSDRTVLNASGYVTARREATVSSKVTGKVAEVFVEEGMKVTQGQILAQLDQSNVNASLALAEAQLSSTRVLLEETKVRVQEADREYRREQDLISKKVTTQSDFDRAEAAALALRAKFRQQQAEVEVAQRSVESWKQQFEDTIIRAPFAGIVTSKNAQPGEMISPMSSGGFTRTGICTIVDMESLEIEIDVNESYINRVRPGQAVEATLDAYPDWKIPCKVIAIIPTADRQKSTVKVRVAFEKLDPRILPEMSVKVGFQEERSQHEEKAGKAVTVPSSAIFQENGRDVLYVVRDGRAERRAVNVASRDKEEVVLTAGATAGERVLIEKPATVQDGASVKEVAP